MDSYTITNAIPKGHEKQLTLAMGERKSVFVRVPRFAQVGKGDSLRVISATSMGCPSADTNDDLIRVLPHFERNLSASLGSYTVQCRITEVSRADDLTAMQFLEQFHYKTHDFLSLSDEEDDASDTSQGVSAR